MLRQRLLSRGLLVLAIVAFVALAATAALAQGHATPANGRAGSKFVKATDSWTWNPVKLGVTRGARVTWSNPTGDDHDVIAYGGNWSFDKTISHGQSVSYIFSNAGTYLFRCAMHSYVSAGVCHGMCGRIVVQK